MDHKIQHLIWLAVASTWTATRVADACPRAGQREGLAAIELQAKNFAEAQRDYQFVTDQCPDDAAAWRNLGRAAGANGDLATAENALDHANDLQRGPDPELHFLRGEFLFALHRDAEATKEHDQAIREIGPDPTDRNARLWLARIQARRGNTAAADALFAKIEADAGAAGDDEAALTHAEVLIRAHQLARGKQVIEGVQSRHPTNQRALELLAWAYEIDGDVDAELDTRAKIAGMAPRDAKANADFGRVLERSGRRAQALTAYERARALTEDPQVVEASERLAHQLAPEVSLGLSGFAEDAANAVRLQVGGGAEVHDGIRFGLIGLVEGGQRGTDTRARSTTAGVIAFVNAAFQDRLDVRGGISYRHGNLPRREIDNFVYLQRDVIGAEASAAAAVGDGVLTMQANYHALWTDAAVSVVEGGDQSGVELHVGYPILDRRLVLDAGALARALQLSREVDGMVPKASHIGFSAGADLVVWRDPTKRLRGEILDERLDRPVYLQDALVVGYRHYEADVNTDATFESRVALAPHASLEAITATARKVLFGDRAGIELRGLAGYDHARETSVLGAGISVYVASWKGGRFVLQSEVANEASVIVKGRRTWSLVSYHHDLL